MKLSIGLVYDLRKEYLHAGYSAEQLAEFDSEETITAVEEALRSLRHETSRIGGVRSLCARLVEGERWDLVFNFAEGMSGRSREAQAPCVLELYGIPYTFSDPLVCAITMDKAVAKRLIQQAGLRTPAFAVVENEGDIDNVRLPFPLFAKPIAEGTGKGIDQRSCIASREELAVTCKELLRRFSQPVLVEEFLSGREFTVGILGTSGRARVLGTMEIEMLPQVGGTIYSLEAKEECETLVRYSKPQDVALRSRVEDLALKSYLALECRDAGRVDIRLAADGSPSLMEINALPGIHPTHSDLPMIATQEGMGYRDLIRAIVDSAWSRVRE